MEMMMIIVIINGYREKKKNNLTLKTIGRRRRRRTRVHVITRRDQFTSSPSGIPTGPTDIVHATKAHDDTATELEPDDNNNKLLNLTTRLESGEITHARTHTHTQATDDLRSWSR